MPITIDRDTLADVMDRVGDFDPAAEFQIEYSGRGMHGRTCVGITSDDPNTPAAFLYILADETDRDFLDLLGELGARTDDMGRSTITYWPGLTVEGSDDDEDEDR